jgi:hypothetical protein
MPLIFLVFIRKKQEAHLFREKLKGEYYFGY